MRRTFLGIAGLAALLLGGPHTIASDQLSRAEARLQLEQLKQDISALQRELERTRSEYTREERALKAADLAIQTSSLEMRKLEADRQWYEVEINRLQTEREDYLESLDQRRDVLAMQIMAAYRLGRESRLKLVLNQDSPALLSRMLAYYDYFSRAQANQIRELKLVLQTLDQMQHEINRALEELIDVQSAQQLVLEELTGQRNERQTILQRISSRIDNAQDQLTRLQQDRQNLEKLLEGLTNVLSDIPADLGKRLDPAELRGSLPLPVSGRVRHAFGQARTEGLHWQGWLINAPRGSEVRSVAYGRVAFSDWLRGYGLLLIIDHGHGYMSLYGHNESLLHDVGDWVEANTPISTVGSSPGSGDGLYFEFRKNGKAVDPAGWLQR